METTETTRLLLDFEETGQTLNVGRTTVYKLADEGEIETVRIGRRRLVIASSVAAYVGRLAGERVAG